MIVNRLCKLGLFEKKEAITEKGLLLFDFITKEKKYLENNLEWEAKSISPDGEKIAITTPSTTTKAFRTELIVMEHKSQQIVLNTNNYFVYDVAFNFSGNKILVVAEKKKPFCYDLVLNKITAEMPKEIRAYKGDLYFHNDTFFVPCEKTKDTCYLFDFNTGKTETIKLGTKAKINRIKFSIDFTTIYAITDTNILYCFDINYKIKWSKDFNYLCKEGGRISPSDIFITEDGQFLCVTSSATEINSWGAEYVVDSTNGEIVRQIESYQFRGRFKSNFFDNKVLLYNLKTIDLMSGQVSDLPII